MRKALVMLMVAGLFATACSDDPEPSTAPATAVTATADEPASDVVAITDDMSLEEQLAAARANWAAAGPRDYDLVVERLCEDPCPPSTVRSTVIGSSLMAWSRPDEGFGPPQTMLDAFIDVDILIRNEMPSEKLVEFDPATGAVVSIVLPFDPARTDDDRETRYRLEAVTPIPATDHGAAVAEAQCAEVDWALAGGSQFDVSLPADMVAQDVEGIDSEVGALASNEFEVEWDFGEYSNDLDYWEGPFTLTNVNYSGIGGRIVVADPVPGFYDGKNVTAVHFSRIDDTYAADGIWGGLTLYVKYADAANAPIADCIVRSIDWLESS